jgi:hypothetical protein
MLAVYEINRSPASSDLRIQGLNIPLQNGHSEKQAIDLAFEHTNRRAIAMHERSIIMATCARDDARSHAHFSVTATCARDRARLHAHRKLYVGSGALSLQCRCAFLAVNTEEQPISHRIAHSRARANLASDPQLQRSNHDEGTALPLECGVEPERDQWAEWACAFVRTTSSSGRRPPLPHRDGFQVKSPVIQNLKNPFQKPF